MPRRNVRRWYVGCDAARCAVCPPSGRGSGAPAATQPPARRSRSRRGRRVACGTCAARSAGGREPTDGDRSPRGRTSDRAPTGIARPGSSRGSAGRCARAPGGTAAVAAASGRRLLAQDRGHRVGRRVAVERAPARQHLVEDRAEAEDVGARVHRLRRAPARATCSRRCRAPCRRSVRRSTRRRVARRRRSSARVSFARPKSRIFTRPSCVTKMFSGFRSRWTMPLSCAAARPSAICTA